MLPDNLYNLLYDKFTVESKKCQWTVCNELSFEICNVHSYFYNLKKPAIYTERQSAIEYKILPGSPVDSGFSATCMQKKSVINFEAKEMRT